MKLKSLSSSLVVSIALVGIGCTIASAGISPNLTLCADKKTGTLRYAASCKSTERLIALNTKGDSGAPGLQGSTGIQGAKGETGPQGQKGETGPQGLAGRDAFEVVTNYKLASYQASSTVSPYATCSDGTLRGYREYKPDEWNTWKWYDFCSFDLNANQDAYVSSMTGQTSGNYLLVIPEKCSDIRFSISGTDSDQITELFSNRFDVGRPPYAYQNSVKEGFMYANEVSPGLLLYPRTGFRCIVLRAATSGSYNYIGSSGAYSLAIINN